jgi:pyruvate,orthophosphate dikinase
MSHDDTGTFLGAYTENEILKKNPFASINQTGDGQLVRIAARRASSPRRAPNSASAAHTAATPNP